MVRKMRNIVVVACVVLCVVFGANIWLRVGGGFMDGANPTVETETLVESGLPVMNITLNSVTLSKIHKNKSAKYSGNVLSLTVGDKTAEYHDVEIKGRGNSTWTQPKRPYQIKFQDKLGLLGMKKAKKWVLLANYFDASNLRTDIAFYLEQMLEAKYALDGKFVELHIDGENLGVYFVTPKMEIDKNRIDLQDSMGILVEMDNLHTASDECFYTSQGNCLIVSDAVDDKKANAAMTNFVKQFNILEKAALKGDFQTVTEVADVESLAKYYLLEEFTVNPDAYNTSYYFYRDGLDDKIHAGPGWDFDYALGNRAWQWGHVKDFHSPLKTQVQRGQAFGGKFYDTVAQEEVTVPATTNVSRIMYYLMDMPEFQRIVKGIFVDKMSGKKMELLAHIREMAEKFGGVIREDSEKWEKNSFDEEMEYLLWWVETRYDYFEQEYGV